MKSSAARKDEISPHREDSGDPVMSEAAESRMARIESDVEHIKADTADLRVELRRTNDKIDVTNKRIEEVRDSLTTKIDGARDDLTGRIEGLRSDLTGRIDGLRNDLTGRIDGLKDKLHSLTIWALLLYFTLAGGLLTVIARAFKWI